MPCYAFVKYDYVYEKYRNNFLINNIEAIVTNNDLKPTRWKGYKNLVKTS